MPVPEKGGHGCLDYITRESHHQYKIRQMDNDEKIGLNGQVDKEEKPKNR